MKKYNTPTIDMLSVISNVDIMTMSGNDTGKGNDWDWAVQPSMIDDLL